MKIWLVSLGYFAVTLVLAYWQRWNATDIAWSMWFASLTSGYALILCGIFGGRAGTTRRSDGFGNRLSTLLFFSVHFIGFHFGHSQIMLVFFPLGDERPAFDDLLVECARRYWPFVVVALLNLRSRLLAYWRQESHPSFDEPYKAVIRNHLVILTVALAATRVNQQQLLYVLLVLYFFPFAQVRAAVFATDRQR